MQSGTTQPPRRPRRFIKVAVVAVILAVVGIYLVNRGSQDRTNGGQAGTPASTNKPTTAGGTLYNAICSNDSRIETAGTLKDSAFSEVSGITSSRRSDDLYWVHNDSGDEARLYAVASSGKLLGSFELPDVKAVDWEDIASGPGPKDNTSYIYISDAGDNDLARDSVEIYRFPEPPVSDDTKKAQDVSGVETLTLHYPDNSGHNVEAMFVDPVSGKLYLIDKSDNRPSQIFEAPSGLTDGSDTMLTKVGELGYHQDGQAYELVTAADISPSGDTIAVRTYDNLYVYDRQAGTSVARALTGTACTTPDLADEHGEAVGFTRSGDGLTTTSEGSKQPIHILRAK
jgi:hypothetical protein